MADKTLHGRFVWHELMTPETAGAHDFYSRVLGWKTQPWDQDPSYSMFAGPSGPLGGSVSEPTGTPRWLPYVGTSDIAQTVERAEALGGRVLENVKTMPNGGKYARLADPQGAAFGVYWSEARPGGETAPKRGEFSWHELVTTDYKAGLDFYAALFGWERIDEHDMGPLGTYLIFGRDGVPKGGMFNKPPDMAGPPAWLGYVRVKDVNRVVTKVKAARGSLVHGPMEVPGGDWIAQFLDPYGAMFAVHAVAADVSRAGSSPSPRAEPREQVEAPAGKTGAGDDGRSTAASEVAPPAKKSARRKAPDAVAAGGEGEEAASPGAPANKAGRRRAQAPARRKTAARKGGRARAPARQGSPQRAAKRSAAKSKTAKSKAAKSKTAKSKAAKSKAAKSRTTRRGAARGGATARATEKRAVAKRAGGKRAAAKRPAAKRAAAKRSAAKRAVAKRSSRKSAAAASRRPTSRSRSAASRPARKRPAGRSAARTGRATGGSRTSARSARSSTRAGRAPTGRARRVP